MDEGRRWNKIYEEENYGGSLKCGGVGGGIGHSVIIIKWTWGFFPKNLQLNHTIRHERVNSELTSIEQTTLNKQG